jgi:hypothetical protein
MASRVPSSVGMGCDARSSTTASISTISRLAFLCRSGAGSGRTVRLDQARHRGTREGLPFVSATRQSRSTCRSRHSISPARSTSGRRLPEQRVVSHRNLTDGPDRRAYRRMSRRPAARAKAQSSSIREFPWTGSSRVRIAGHAIHSAMVASRVPQRQDRSTFVIVRCLGHKAAVGPSLGSRSFGSIRLRSFIISSQVTVRPEYAAMRPRIAERLLSTLGVSVSASRWPPVTAA